MIRLVDELDIEVRSRERMSYQSSSKHRGLTQKVLVKAKEILEEFYKSKDPRNGYITGYTGSRSTWSLNSRSELGPSVLNLLETIMADFKKEQSDADRGEKLADQELEKALVDSTRFLDYVRGKEGHEDALRQEAGAHLQAPSGPRIIVSYAENDGKALFRRRRGTRRSSLKSRLGSRSSKRTFGVDLQVKRSISDLEMSRFLV